MENTEMVITNGTHNLSVPAAVDSTIGTGFEDANNEDVIIPRIKVINALSPERLDGIAEEGAILNTLTQEDVRGKRFIPVKVFYSNIEWNPDRNDEDNRIFCNSRDGITGNVLDIKSAEKGCTRSCKTCKRNQFDNSKTGDDAKPKCTAYMNFLGFFADSALPVVISFSRTNYNEGRKFLSIAKSLRASLWSYAYTFDSKLITKGKNRWYNIVVNMLGATEDAERQIATGIYQNTQVSELNIAEPESTDYTARKSVVVDPATEEELF